MEAAERSTEAALRLIADAHVADTFAFLTLERLHNEISHDGHGTPPDRRRISREFADGTRFSALTLVHRALAAVVDEIIGDTLSNADGYVAVTAAGDLGAAGRGLLTALADDQLTFDPLGDNDHRNGRARLFHLCCALADNDRTCAALLRRYFERHTEIYVESGLYEQGLGLIRRALAPGVTTKQLHAAVHNYLRGTVFYARCGLVTPDPQRMQTIIRIVWSHSVPTAEPESPTLDECLAVAR